MPSFCILHFLTVGKFQFSKRKSLIDHDESDNINNKRQFYTMISKTAAWNVHHTLTLNLIVYLKKA